MSTSIRNDPWNYSCNDCDSCESKYACPINNCSECGNRQYRWTHSNCGGSFRLYENGKEKCEKCGTEDLFCNFWSNHGGNNNNKISYCKIKNILAKLAGMDTIKCSTYFLLHVGMCIDKQYRDYPEKFDY